MLKPALFCQVAEKESGVRSALSTMGMLSSAHWLSVALPELILGAIHACLMTAMARAMQFQMVIVNDFILLLLLIFLANTALVAMGFAISACIQK